MLELYWQYLAAKENDWNLDVISQLPHFYSHSLMWGIFFTALYPTFNVICREMFPKIYGQVTEAKRGEFMSYLVCLVHHGVVVPAGIYYVYNDIHRDVTELKTFNYAAEYAWIVPFIFGYFIADTVAFAVPRSIEGSHEYLFHHILGLGLIFSVVHIEDGVVVKLCPHMFICELSSCFFTFAYLCRLCGYRGSSLVFALEILFAISFFFTRNVHLTAMLWSVKNEMMARYKAAGVILILILILQFYWLFKIVKSLLKKKSSVDEKNSSKKQK